MISADKISFITWAASSSLSLPSYWIKVPPFTSARVLSVTSITNSLFCWMTMWRMLRSTVAPRLSMLETKQYFLPALMYSSRSPLLKKD